MQSTTPIGRSLLAVVAFLTLKTGLAAVGVTTGSHGVTRTGTATYDIPLVLPPDRLTPSIGISYNHGRGNGLLGLGFAISGFSSIQRCGFTIAQDGVASPVHGGEGGWDGYCLDGNRLRLTSGQYGQSNSTYQTEQETFARATAHGNSVEIMSWTLEMRDGSIHEYGATPDSHIEPVGAPNARVWALNRIRDRVGNYIDFTYTLDTENGSYRPNEIRYSGNFLRGIAPSTRVVFVYETATRPDPIYQYRQAATDPGSGIIVEYKRVDRIDVVNEATSQAVRTYDLTYDPAGGAGGRTRLSSVRECVGGDCLAATAFQWVSGTSSWPVAETSTGSAVPSPSSTLVLDFDNDGQEDILYPSSATSGAGSWFVLRGSNTGYLAPLNTGASNWSHSSAQVIEWDGDGAADLLVPCSSGTTWCVFYQRTGTPPNLVFASTPLDTGISIIQPGTAAPADWLAADIDGDGRSDLLRMGRPSAGNHFIAARIRQGSGFSAEMVVYQPSFTIASNFASLIAAKRNTVLRRIDFDGDGREDFYIYYNHPQTSDVRVMVLRGYDVPFVDNYVEAETTIGGGDSAVIYPGDFNGDGLTDLAYPYLGAFWRVHFGNGRGVTFEYTAGPSTPSSTVQLALMADMDADGMTDILIKQSSSANWLYSRSYGNAFGPLVDIGLNATSTASPVVMDLNGDGLQDIARADSAAGSGWKFRLHAGAVPDLLDRVTDGYGNYVDFDYRSTATDDPFYIPSPVGYTYPGRNYRGPMILVERFTANDGVGGSYFVRYEYGRGVMNQHGRGFQGFGTRTIYDSREQRYVWESLRTYFPYNSWPWREVSWAAGLFLYEKRFEQDYRLYGSGHQTRYQPFVEAITEEQYGEDAARSIIERVTTVNIVDNWGTITDQTVTLEEVSSGLNTGATHTRRTWYPLVVNDETNWCIGKPAQTLQINSHTLPGGAQITRTENRSWDTSLCRLSSILIEPGHPNWQVTTDYAYDSFGNVSTVTVTPAAGQGQSARTTSISWGSSGRFPLTIVNPLSQPTTISWDLTRGLRTSVTDANGLTRALQYDAFGRVTRVLNPDGTAVELNLSWCNTPACQGPDPNIKTYLQEISKTTLDAEITQVRHYFDGFNRETLKQSKMLNGAYSSTRHVVNARGLLHQVSTPFVTSGSEYYATITYDRRFRPKLIRRPTSDNDPTNHDTQFTYDGLQTIETDALGRTTTTYLNAAGEVVQVLDPTGQDTRYEYDAFGNLVKTRDPLGSEIVLTYNVRGMKMSSSDPDMGQWAYSYYPLGELKSQTDAKNQTLTLTYDQLSRALTWTMPEGSGSITGTFAWGTSSVAKSIGRLEWMQVAGTGVTTYRETYVYDSYGRASQTTFAEGATNYFVNYAYNSGTGFLEEITYPTSTSGFRWPIRYEYQNGLPSKVSSSTSNWWIASATDARGNVTQATLGDATIGVTFETLSSYDLVTGLLESRLSTYSSGAVSGTVIANLGFLYDRAGNVIQRQDNQQGLTENFYYDNLNRLDYSTFGAATTDYSYDVRGNLTAKSDVGSLYSYTASVPSCTYYSHPQIHAVRQITGGSSTLNFCYDANGNMSNRNGTSLTWFANNLPKAITKDANNSSVFEYTPTGRRWRHVYRTGGSSYTHTYIGNLVEKVVGPTTTDWKHYVYVNGEAIGVYIRKSNGAKTTHFFVKDHIGSTAAVTHGGGNWTMRESFDAFGQRRGPAWTGSPSSTDLTRMKDTTRRGFTSHEHLDSTNLIHMNGRVYDPQIGRFVSADPFIQAPHLSQSLNRYSYALNSPLNYTDPSGYGWDDSNWFDFDFDFGWGEFFGGEHRSMSSTCTPNDQSGFCQGSRYFREAFNACGFNLRCLQNFRADHPPPWSNSGSTPTPAPPEPPPSTPVPPTQPPPTTPTEPTPVPPPTPPATPAPTPITIRDTAPASTVRGSRMTIEEFSEYNSREIEELQALLDMGDGTVPYVDEYTTMDGVNQLLTVASVIPVVRSARGLATVYRSVNAAGKVQYVGITNNLARRAAEHLRGSGIQIEKLLGGLSRSDARAVEQALIQIHGLQWRGGTLQNRINSIARTNPTYADQLRHGYELLRTVGY